MEIWLYSIISVLIVSFISLMGVLTIAFSREIVKKILLFLVSFSAGALLGDVFIHILPELTENGGLAINFSIYILSGILLFFVLEKFIIWHHCHNLEEEKECRPFAYTNLAGDALHNFIDGMIIAGSFLVNVPLGIITSLAVAFHEIPQEMGDFGILLHAGFSKTKAITYNLMSALTAVLGAAAVLIVGLKTESFSSFMLSLTAGAFIYIAAADLIPELHKENSIKKSFYQLIFFIFGLTAMALLLLIE